MTLEAKTPDGKTWTATDQTDLVNQLTTAGYKDLVLEWVFKGTKVEVWEKP